LSGGICKLLWLCGLSSDHCIEITAEYGECRKFNPRPDRKDSLGKGMIGKGMGKSVCSLILLPNIPVPMLRRKGQKTTLCFNLLPLTRP